MANINVSYQDIQETKSALETGRGELVDTLNRLKTKVDQLVNSGFVTDQASGAFQASYEQFTKGATETVNGLTGIQQFLQSTQEAMQDLDQQLKNALNS